MRRSICTSEPRRASTRVSSGFTLFEHSSPSFGSHRTRSDRNGAESATVRRRCATPSLWVVLVSKFTFVEPLCYELPRTRAHVRLLGPCFKTGPMRPQIESLSLRRRRSAAHPRRVGASGTSVDEGDSLRVRGTAGRRRKARRTGRLVAPRPNPPRRTPYVSNLQGPAAWALIRTVSRTVELSFQSSFHLSLAVLVRYRSRARIEPWMESTTRLWAAIPNNPTLGRRSSGGAGRALAHGVLTLSDAPFQETRRATAPPRSLPSVYNSDTRCRIPTVGRFPLHSPLLRESWLVSRPPPSDMLKFGG